MTEISRPSDRKVGKSDFVKLASTVVIPAADCTADELAKWVQDLSLSKEIEEQMITVPDFVPKTFKAEGDDEEDEEEKALAISEWRLMEKALAISEWQLMTRIPIAFKLFVYQINNATRTKGNVPINQLTYLAAITNNRRIVDDIFLMWHLRPLQWVADVITADIVFKRSYSFSIVRFLIGYGVKCLKNHPEPELGRTPQVRCRYAVYCNTEERSDMIYLSHDYGSSLHATMDKHQISHICFELDDYQRDTPVVKLHIKRVRGHESEWLQKHGFLQFTRAMVDHVEQTHNTIEPLLVHAARNEKYVRFNMYLARIYRWSGALQHMNPWTDYDQWDEKDAAEFVEWAGIPKGKERPAWWAAAVEAGAAITKWQIFNQKHKRGRNETGAGLDDIVFSEPLKPHEIPTNAVQAIKLLQEGKPKDFIQLASTRTLSQQVLSMITAKGADKSFEQMDPAIVDHSVALYLSVIGWSDLKRVLTDESESADIDDAVYLFTKKPVSDFSLPVLLAHYQYYESLTTLAHLLARYKYNLWMHVEADIPFLYYLLYCNTSYQPELQKLIETFNLQVYLSSFTVTYSTEKADLIHKHTVYNDPQLIWAADTSSGSPIANSLSFEDALEFQQYCIDQKLRLIRFELDSKSAEVQFSHIFIVPITRDKFLHFTDSKSEIAIFQRVLGDANYSKLLAFMKRRRAQPKAHPINTSLYNDMYPEWDAQTKLESPPPYSESYTPTLRAFQERLDRRQSFDVPIELPLYYLGAKLSIQQKQWALANRQVAFEPIQTRGWVIYNGIPIMPEYITMTPEEMSTIVRQIHSLPNDLETVTFAARFFPSIGIVLEHKYWDFWTNYMRTEFMIKETEPVSFDWRPIAYGLKAEKFRITDEFINAIVDNKPLLTYGWDAERSLLDFEDGGRLFANVVVALLLARHNKATAEVINSYVLAAILVYIMYSSSVTNYTIDVLITYLKRQFRSINTRDVKVQLEEVRVTGPLLHFMTRFPELCVDPKFPFQIGTRRIVYERPMKQPSFLTVMGYIDKFNYQMKYFNHGEDIPTTPRAVDERWEPTYMYTSGFGVGQALATELRRFYVLRYRPDLAARRPGQERWMSAVSDKKEYVARHTERLRLRREALTRADREPQAAVPVDEGPAADNNNQGAAVEDDEEEDVNDAEAGDDDGLGALVAGVASASISTRTTSRSSTRTTSRSTKPKGMTGCQTGDDMRVGFSTKRKEGPDDDCLIC